MKIRDIEIELLEAAYQYIEYSDADYVCCALHDAHWLLRRYRNKTDKIRSDVALDNLKAWIATMLQGDAVHPDEGAETLEEWVRDYHYDLYRNTEYKHKYARQTRLNWIKWMIRQIKEQA